MTTHLPGNKTPHDLIHAELIAFAQCMAVVPHLNWMATYKLATRLEAIGKPLDRLTIQELLHAMDQERQAQRTDPMHLKREIPS